MNESQLGASRPLLVGVSGGADSTFLLHALVEEDPAGLVVCHLNHGLRGKESDGDERFVVELCEELGVTVECKKIGLPEIMKEEGVSSLETAAREERLRFFQEMAEKHACREVALAHHADDQAETILMKLCRGSAGVKGISERTHLRDYDLTLWHPLLFLRKREIIASLEARGLRWREDQTNKEGIATRNRIRNEALPLLDDIFQRDVSVPITRSLSGDLSPLLPEIFTHLKVYDPQGRLFLPTLHSFSPELLKHLLHHYLKENGVRDLSEAKVSECLSLINDEEVWKVNLPGGKFLRRKEKRIFLDA